MSAVLIMAGLLGQAAAATSTESTAKLAPARAQPAAKPKPHRAGPRTESVVHRNRTGPRFGPAGSLKTTGSKAVALTFDDGPDPAQTPRLLRLLAKERVRATFCVVGSNAAAHPKLIRKIVAGGHTLCNHSWDHDLKLGKKPPAAIRADFERTNAAIRAAVPTAKIRYMRAPGGNFTPAMVTVSRRLGMTPIYWKVDPRDWDHPAGETPAQHRARIVAVVKQHTRAGAIVLSHDYAQPETVAAYRSLLPWLRKRFKLVALP